jgi:hypothetical protein
MHGPYQWPLWPSIEATQVVIGKANRKIQIWVVERSCRQCQLLHVVQMKPALRRKDAAKLGPRDRF